MSPLASAYYDRSLAMLATAREKNSATIAKLTPILGASVARGEVIHTFGSGHSEIIAREIVGRAGGLVCITSLNDPTAGFNENHVGYGTALVERYDRQYELRAGGGGGGGAGAGGGAAPRGGAGRAGGEG